MKVQNSVALAITTVATDPDGVIVDKRTHQWELDAEALDVIMTHLSDLVGSGDFKRERLFHLFVNARDAARRSA